MSNIEKNNKESRLCSACCLFENMFNWLDISHTYLYITDFALCYFLAWTIIPLFISHVFLLSMIVENMKKFGILSIVKQQPFCFYAEKLKTVFSVDKVGFYLLGALFLQYRERGGTRKAPFCSFSHFQIKYVFKNKEGSKCFFGQANRFAHINLVCIYGFHCEFGADHV